MSERSAAGEVEAAEDLGRRKFLGFMSGLLSAVVAAALGVPLVGMFLAPAFRKREQLWVELGPLSDITADKATKFTYSYVKKDGWLEKTERRTAYAVKPESGDLYVLSNICTHLGCGVRWDDEARGFLCPCHNGVFNLDGSWRSGPPPRPLDRFEVRTGEGVIEIRIREV